ncbi:MAG: hypothetical protein CVU97_03350 [Firmicutes bacterium HGW-Firmicutes-21]|nr:MAG: hypothetical protein CVU97_03350 [Firmicutes bacterium HGW-Firmicutes-21]
MEQIRGLINESEEKKFKKSIFGFDKKEIFEHIDALENNFRNSIYNYEKKLSEQANALTMALREKETLAEKAAELDKQVKILSVDVDQHKSLLVAENNALKERIQALEEYESKNELLLNEMIGLKTRCEYAEAERQSLLETIKEKDEVISEQCKQNAQAERVLKIETEKIKAQYESVRKIQLLNIQSLKENLSKITYTVEQL